ncbi:uncharacterized protein MYCFIDRAFT_86491 [Pseudocercospora fijiensis CIRAD86]|uniref:Outer spore wall protein RRT8 n=1 Tax=Pseudocercospora fijiensis (strain CIRAD86) TaxID=383855 RepID=M3AR85_PSEFD|nr:uncharacterized protein MYCFIDRAFT_86491 [Pseudocercospora fijiensis CIRAD86]EME87116.1 hypothetical protein MYCFIDRAFT_86491 [Pseudocercospora fijiensis CIRAD86]
MADKVKATVQEELSSVQKAASDGVKSGAYIYPIKGIVYFFSHKDLWKPFASKLVPTMGLGLGVTIFMFAVTYLPQLAVLLFTSGPLAVVSTVFLVLSEISTLTMVLAKALLIEDSLIDTFDGTLVARGHTALVERDRQVKSNKYGDAIQRLGKLASKPFSKLTPSAVIRYLMYLPLNFIPVVGTAIFIILRGKAYGPQAHARYFQLKGMSGPQRERFVEQRRGAFTGFGIPATLLETIPIAGILFAFTNTCGAALMAADLEQKGETSPELKERASKSQ